MTFTSAIAMPTERPSRLWLLGSASKGSLSSATGQLPPATLWPEALTTALSRSRSVVVFLGADGLGKGQSDEVETLISEGAGRRVIPALFPGSDPERLPRFLRNRLWVDFRQGLNNEKAFQDLLRGILGSTTPYHRLLQLCPCHRRKSRSTPSSTSLPACQERHLRADAFRLSREADCIHMEHLLVGLFDEGDESVRQIFERAGIGRPELVNILRQAKVSIFRWADL